MPTGWQPKHGAGGDLRAYLEKERSSLEGYYLAGEADGVADRHVVSVSGERSESVLRAEGFDAWIGGVDPVTGEQRGQLRQQRSVDGRAQTTAYEHIVAAPKSLSVLAAVDRSFAPVLRDAQERQVRQIERALTEQAVVRRTVDGRQVQVPVARLEFAAAWHSYSRAGDPHAHAHLFVNAKAQTEDGRWYAVDGKHLMQALNRVTNSVELAGLTSDRQLQEAVAARGFGPLDERGRIAELEPYCRELSARQRQIEKHREGFRREWERTHPGQTPGPELMRSIDGRAWAIERAAKDQALTPETVRNYTRGKLAEQGLDLEKARPAIEHAHVERPETDGLARAAVRRLGAQRATWSAYDVRAAVGVEIAATGWTGDEQDLHDLLDEAAGHANTAYCRSVLSDEEQAAVKLQTPTLTSDRVLAVEREYVDRLVARADAGGERAYGLGEEITGGLSVEQRQAVELLAGDHRMAVIEGAAGSGKTFMLARAKTVLEGQGRELRVVAPSRVAAHVAGEELEAQTDTVHGLLYAHGVRWDEEANWRRLEVGERELLPSGHERVYRGVPAEARLAGRTRLVVDEAGMLGQDEALWLARIADEGDVDLAYVGDRRQLAAVGRSGAYDLAANTAADGAYSELVDPQRFKVRDQATGEIRRDDEFAELMRAQRVGEDPGRVFDELQRRGQIVLVEDRDQAVQQIAEQAANRRTEDLEAGRSGPSHIVPVATNADAGEINTATREQLVAGGLVDDQRVVLNSAGDRIGAGDVIVTRQNQTGRETGQVVMNRQVHTVEGVQDGALRVRGTDGERRTLRADYVAGQSVDGRETPRVQLAYAQTTHGSQGITADSVQQLHSEQLDAAGLYVGLTRGRYEQQLVMVAGSEAHAREQFVATTGRDAPALTIHRAQEQAREELARQAEAAAERERRAQAREQHGAAGRAGIGEDKERAERPVVQFDREAERQLVEAQTPDRVAETRLWLGERAGQLPQAEADRSWAREASTEELQHAAAQGVPGLDRRGTLEIRSWEETAAEARRQRQEYQDRIEDLQQQREQAGGFRGRGERTRLDEEIAKQQIAVEKFAREAERADSTVEQLNDRLGEQAPDRWLEQHADAWVHRQEAQRELEVRQELEIREAGDIAIQGETPEHVRELLGDREQAGTDTASYDQLTRDTERHRITHGVDVEDHGALGPDRRRRGEKAPAYEQSRSALAGRAADYRESKGMERSDQLEKARPAAAIERSDAGHGIGD